MKLGDGVGREPSPDAGTYTYDGIGFLEPDALTQITDGHSITTYAYDAKGPLTSTLGGTNVTSDSSMNVAQWFDYAPYGSVLATTNTGQTGAARGYIGQFSDQSGLSYLNARYYNGAQGQFTSQDPMFLALGNPNQLQQISQQDQQRFLDDPQQMNSYSYSENNPIVKSDPSGKFAPALAPVMYGLGDLGLAATAEFWGVPALIGASVAALSVGAYSLYHDKTFTTSIEVNGGVNDTTNLPNKTPNDPRNKIFYGILGVTGLIAFGEEFFGNADQAGKDFGGLTTYTSMPRPVMVNNLNKGNGAPVNQSSTGSSSGGRSGGGSSGSSAALVGLYQSLVATLTAIVSVLSTSKH